MTRSSKLLISRAASTRSPKPLISRAVPTPPPCSRLIVLVILATSRALGEVAPVLPADILQCPQVDYSNAVRHDIDLDLSNGRHIHLGYYEMDGFNITQGDIKVNPDLLKSALRYSELQSEHTSLKKSIHKSLLAASPEEEYRSHSRIQMLEASLLAEEASLLGIYDSDSPRWDCPLPYEIEANFPDPEKILEGLALISSATRWQFVERTTEASYLKFVNSSGCLSYIGRLSVQNQPQEIQISPACNFATVAHEVFHAMGIPHEHVRSDRETFVEVHEEYIVSSDVQEDNFDIPAASSGFEDLGPYDFGSVMHYDSLAFSTSRFNYTISVRPNYIDHVCSIGQRFELSRGDAEAAMQVFTPGGQCGTETTPPPRTRCEPGAVQICGRYGSNSFINGVYVPNGTFSGRTAYLKADGFYLFYNGNAWRIYTELGSSFSFATVSDDATDPTEISSTWLVVDFVNETTENEIDFFEDDRVSCSACQENQFRATPGAVTAFPSPVPTLAPPSPSPTSMPTPMETAVPTPLPTPVPGPTQCRIPGIDGFVPQTDCCSEGDACAESEGNCNSNNECAAGLFCGIEDSCQRIWGSNVFPEGYACCIRNMTATPDPDDDDDDLVASVGAQIEDFFTNTPWYYLAGGGAAIFICCMFMCCLCTRKKSSGTKRAYHPKHVRNISTDGGDRYLEAGYRRGGGRSAGASTAWDGMVELGDERRAGRRSPHNAGGRSPRSAGDGGHGSRYDDYVDTRYDY